MGRTKKIENGIVEEVKTEPNTYFVVKAADMGVFMEQVEACISKGWKPIGGVAVSKDNTSFNAFGTPIYCYFQAMIRE